MVTIKFVGGAKKSFSTDQLELDIDGVTIEKLLEILLDIKPKNTPTFDTNNILIAVNGADSSAMEGKKTLIKNSDLISIIPVIHGVGTYFNYIFFWFLFWLFFYFWGFLDWRSLTS